MYNCSIHILIDIILNYHFTPCEFFTPALMGDGGGVHWSPSQRKSLRISRTLLIISADFSSTVVWMIPILCLQFTQSLYQVLGEHFKGSYYKWYHCHLYISQLFSSLLKFRSLSSFFAVFNFHSMICCCYSKIQSDKFFTC